MKHFCAADEIDYMRALSNENRKEVFTLNKVIGILLLASWLPFVLALAFPDSADGWYLITGLMLFVFGTWGGILLVKGK